MKKIFTALLLAPLFLNSNAQTFDQELWQDLTGKFIKQMDILPQEKIFLHRDKSAYVAGEMMWLRAYVLNAITLQPFNYSRYVYVDLIDPANGIVRTVKLRNEEGVCQGYIELPSEMAEGGYSLRAYTLNMRNLPEDYFYLEPVFIAASESVKFDLIPRFTYDERGGLSVEFTTVQDAYYESSAGAPKFFHGDGEVSGVKSEGDTLYRFDLRSVSPEEPGTVRVQYGQYRKFFQLPYRDDIYSVSFFPEGGSLVAGERCRVAFEARRPDGTPVRVTGTVKNSRGEDVAGLETYHDGMGLFAVEYMPGETYTVECSDGAGRTREFTLPQAEAGAVSLAVERYDGNVAVSLLGERPPGGLHILAHCRGVPLYVGSFEDNDVLLFPEGMFPAGVIHFMLIDRDLNIYSERLAFSMNGYRAGTTVIPDKEKYGLRDLAHLNISVDGLIEGQSAFMSLSVTDDKDISPVSESSIYASLLLSSDLRGYIPAPEFYFGPGEQRRTALDILMMVNGWRRYDMPAVLRGETTFPEFPLEAGEVISGTVKAFVRNRPLAGGQVSMLAFPAEHLDITVTDENGRFSFMGFEFPDSTTFIVNAFNRKGKVNAVLEVDEITYPGVGIRLPAASPGLRLGRDYLAKTERKYIEEHGMRVIDIEEVTFTATRKRSKVTSLTTGRIPGSTFSSEYLEKFGDTRLKVLLSTLHTVHIEDDLIYMTVQGVNKSVVEPMVILDGLYLYNDVGHIMNVPVSDILSIEVYLPPNATVGGSIHDKGLIIIESKSGNALAQNRQYFNIQNVTPLGYQTPVEFYAPAYGSQGSDNDRRRDLRTTIHWAPNITVGEDGNSASVDFYTADEPSSYTVTVQGVASDGRLIGTSTKLNIADR